MDIEKIEDIKSKLKEKGYTKKLISYEKLKELYQEYGANMEEKIFARQVLEIDDRNYNNAKNKGTRVTIFKGKEEIKEGKIEQIKQSLIEQGYTGKSINYEELKELYQEYGTGMQEKTFVQEVLGINMSNYNNAKYIGKSVRILKGRENIIEGEIEQIKQSLIEQGYTGKLIDCKELKELYKKYGAGMLEKVFAEQVLEIKWGTYRNVKCGNRRAKILKGKEEIKEGEIEQIKQTLIEKGYMWKAIDCEELKELYQEYGTGMQEKTFVQEVLGINMSNYNNAKNKGTRVRILKGRENITEGEIEQIKQSLIEQEYASKSINYEEVKALYREYGAGIQEKIFVHEVLGINMSNYNNAKNRGTRVRILKGRENITEGEIEQIKQILIEQGYMWKVIDCEELKALYQEYGADMQEKTFVQEVLGINYNYAKYRETGVRILKGRKNMTEEEIEQIKQSLIEQGYAGKLIGCEELKELYQQYGVGRQEKVFAEQVLGIKWATYRNAKCGRTRVRILKGKLQEKILGYENVKIVEEEEISLDEKCVQELKRQIEIGVSREEALKNVSEQLGLGQEEMLNAMQTYLMTKGRVEVSRRGKKVYLTGAMDEEGR